MRIQLGKILQENLVEKSSWKILQEILVGKFCGKIMLAIPAWNFCKENLTGKFCGKILLENLAVKSCGKEGREEVTCHLQGRLPLPWGRFPVSFVMIGWLLEVSTWDVCKDPWLLKIETRWMESPLTQTVSGCLGSSEQCPFLPPGLWLAKGQVQGFGWWGSTSPSHHMAQQCAIDMQLLVGGRGYVRVCQARDLLDGTPTPWAEWGQS